MLAAEAAAELSSGAFDRVGEVGRLLRRYAAQQTPQVCTSLCFVPFGFRVYEMLVCDHRACDDDCILLMVALLSRLCTCVCALPHAPPVCSGPQRM
jgi:hypothetical protein